MNKMRWILLVLCLAIYCPAGLAQSSVEGKILDSNTGKGIAFVNVGIAAKGIGTVSDEKGWYRLQILDKKDEVTFSSIGYSTKALSAANLLKEGEIRLDPKVYEIEELELSSRKFGPEIILGKKFEKRYHSVGFGSQQLGTEVAAYIEIEKETLLKSAHFILNHGNGDSVLFRVNIFDFKDGRIRENLVPENVIIATAQKKGTLSVDLSAYNIITDNDVLLCLEWIKDDNGKGNEGITFGSKKTRSGKKFYIRQASQGYFQPFSQAIPYAPKLELGFYMIAKQVE
ncbi:MAG: hypothetical protein DHS20C18_00080 [Saprospiraceae bacterium]|nr:MAG: hypothetical protein DHS20C18_00080 [Saprospiraceae bacterium]